MFENRSVLRFLTGAASRVVLLGLALLLSATIAACGGSSSAPLVSREGLRVVATTNLVGDVVGRVGGDRIQLTTLMAVGADPHSYVPAPSDVAAIHDADLLFANGAGLEEFLAETLANAGGDAVQVYLSDGLSLRPLDDGHEGEGDHDPHVWFDVQNVVRWVGAVERSLSALDPDNAAVYRANAEAYTRELEALDAWIVQEVAAIPEANRKLVINHPFLGYFAGRYGFEQIGAVYPLNPSAEPSAQDLAALEEAIRRLDVPAVFAENTVSAKLAEQVSKDTGVKLVLLYTGSLGGPGTGVETYLDLMRYDVRAIVEALR
ncbi:MAG: zinc ABC transporter substrate-binding protein [Anaerolineae bacterium]|nr:zinc ABC transporter substrate-binding protein [Anaerolineae bacterium]